MNNIEWKEGAVCFANGKQFYAADSGLLFSYDDTVAMSCSKTLNYDDFQLNEIRQGDYIQAQDLDTEQKYNDAVAVFGLFGFARNGKFALDYKGFMRHKNEDCLVCFDGILMGIKSTHLQCKRKTTYPQLMAIGKLKRAMIER
ncbi:MAG TPA: hypothetical protein VIC51_11080, partial [Psychromonas sp.]